jgi:hypothetical protein
MVTKGACIPAHLLRTTQRYISTFTHVETPPRWASFFFKVVKLLIGCVDLIMCRRQPGIGELPALATLLRSADILP